MSISSMTGFARSDGNSASYNWTWEVKSVNGKGLDIRFRAPSGLEALEPKARTAAADRFRRGNLSLLLQVSRANEEPILRINRALLGQLAGIAKEFEGRLPVAEPRLDGLLAVRGVVEVAEPEETADARDQREAAMVASLARALDSLAASRDEEGTRIAEVLHGQINEMERLVKAASDCAALRPEAIRERLRAQVEALLGANPALPEDRLAQEAALLAAKGDVREELDRLRSHVTAARELLDPNRAERAVGRRLDFLSQEFNREANTLCSKSGDIELTRLGLELKATVDRFREQIQNIE